jgi:hypothetical protein
MQEFLNTSKLTGITQFLQFPPEPRCIVATVGPSIFQVLSIRFQGGAASPGCLLGKFGGLKKTPDSLSRETQLSCDCPLGQTALMGGSNGFEACHPSFPTLLALLLVSVQLGNRQCSGHFA